MSTLPFRQLVDSLREGRFTSLGSYPKFYVTADGGVLSHEAVRSNLLQVGRAMGRLRKYPCHGQWRVVSVQVNWEDPELYCDDTGERIESAYAEKEAHEHSG